MNYRKQLRIATRQAIGQANITLAQRVLCRARLASCTADDTIEMLEDELIQRNALPSTTNAAVDAVMQGLDWAAIVKVIIKIIEDIFANK